MTSQLALFLTLVVLHTAQARTWTDSTGTRSFEAEFISRTESEITLEKPDGQSTTFPIERLHASDQAYLKEHHPLDSELGTMKGNAYGPLNFGDNKDLAERKLFACPLVKTDVAKELMGRTGLNGIFETVSEVGGLKCQLYFHWDGGFLQEVTLRSPALQESDYLTTLKPCWSAWVELCTQMFGQPISHTAYPKFEKLETGAMIASHLWHNDEGNSILLGTGLNHEGYNVSVRFTNEHIKPVAQ